jgi:N utilization substance protein A
MPAIFNINKMQKTQARTEFSQALKAIASERGLEPTVIVDTIKEAIVAAYRRDAKERGEETEEFEYEVELNPGNGEAKVFAWPLEKPEEKKDVTPPGFGRIAAQTAKQVIHQKIREAEKGAIMEEFSGRVGNLISGMVLRFDGPNVRVDLGRTEALMPAEERIPTERLVLNQRMSFLLKGIEDTLKGKEIILSRADPIFVEKLFAREVPEIASGNVVVKGIAREPGTRTKITVASSQSGVDPVGSCVGQKGVRVQAVTNELGGERVDIIPWNEDVSELIASSLSPAEGIIVTLNKKENTAVVKAPEDQLSLAIGKEGQNVRLAAKLTGWRIEVEGIPGTKLEEEPVIEEKPAVVEEKVEAVEEPIKEEVKEEKIEEVKEVTEEPVIEEVKEEAEVKEETKEPVVEETVEEKSETPETEEVASSDDTTQE